MKKILTILFFVLAFSVFNSSPLRVFAQETSGTPQQINARILPLIWYSTLSINDGDSIKIYSGIQNNSGINFTGTATFYVDDKEISKSSFTSSDNSLKDISGSWLANPGSHNVQVKIITSLSADKILVSYDSDKSSINITQKITPEVVATTVLNTASNIIGKTNDMANVLADKIESFKKPVGTAENITNSNTDNSKSNNVKVSTSTSQAKDGVVLSASIGPVSNSDTKNSSKMDSAFNMVLDALAFLVRNWMWTLGAIIVLFLIIKFKK